MLLITKGIDIFVGIALRYSVRGTGETPERQRGNSSSNESLILAFPVTGCDRQLTGTDWGLNYPIGT